MLCTVAALELREAVQGWFGKQPKAHCHDDEASTTAVPRDSSSESLALTTLHESSDEDGAEPASDSSSRVVHVQVDLPARRSRAGFSEGSRLFTFDRRLANRFRATAIGHSRVDVEVLSRRKHRLVVDRGGYHSE